MQWKKKIYWLHRWVGLIVGLQLLAWSVGGFMFGLLGIDNVRGELEKNSDAIPKLAMDRVQLSPQQAIERFHVGDRALIIVTRVVLRSRLDRVVYDLFDYRNNPLGAVDAETGEFITRISKDEAAALALSDFVPEAKVVSVNLIEDDPPLEFRKKPLPAYQVILDHPKQPHIYVSAVTGDILARRNKPWRIFDFFWMLHIMDYGNREDFSHTLLTAASIFAIVTSCTGMALWWFRVPFGKNRKRRRQIVVIETATGID